MAENKKVNGVLMPTFAGVAGAKLHLVNRAESWAAFYELLMQQKVVACDTETSGFHWFKDHQVVGVSFGWDKTNFYIPFRHEESVLGGPEPTQLSIEDVKEDLQAFFAQKDVFTLWHNWKFDAHFYSREGIEILTPFHDTRILWHLYDENAPGRLKTIASGWKDDLGRKQKGIVDPKASTKEKEIDIWRGEEAKARRKVFTKLVKEKAEELAPNPEYQSMNKNELKKFVRFNILQDHKWANVSKADIHYGMIPVPLMCEYAGLDTFFTYSIYRYCMKNVAWTKGLKNLYLNEIKLTKALKVTEENGVCIDVDFLKLSSHKLQKEEEALALEVKKVVGEEVNLDSPMQLAEALVAIGVPLTKKTNTGNLSVDKKVLAKLAKEYPIVHELNRYRLVKKLRNTYVEAIISKVVDNILHCSFNQNVSTGRMSSNDPNLQNIPKDEDIIRRAFVPPDDDYVYVFADYSQIEVRLTAHFSQDPLLLDAYAKGQDVHTRTMCEMFGEFYEEVVEILDDRSHPRYKELDILRNISKRINFGIIYGVGASGLSEQIPRPDACEDMTERDWIRMCQSFIDDYMSKYLGVKRFINQGYRIIKKNSKVENHFGRIRHLPHASACRILKNPDLYWMEASAKRQGLNFLVQGTAADLFKMAIVRVHELLQGTRSKIVNYVHDEIQLYIHKDELHLLKDIKRCMEDFEFSVPIIVDFEYTRKNWAEKRKI